MNLFRKIYVAQGVFETLVTLHQNECRLLPRLGQVRIEEV
jgi:hypothetical protein